MSHIKSFFKMAFKVIVGLVFVGAIIFLFLNHQTTENNAYQKNLAVAKITAQKEAAAQALANSNTQLKTLVDTFSAPYGTKVAVSVMDLSNGATATDNADLQFVAASVYKMFVAYNIYKKVDNGQLTLDQKMSGNGETGQTIDGCLKLMITISDNDCGYALGEIANWADLDTILKAEGYTATFTNNYDSTGALNGDKLTTAHDAALLLQRLYAGTLLKSDTTADFFTYLKADEYDEWLPSGLPAGTVIAHKTGALYGYVHDAGIVYSAKKNAIIVMMSGEWDNPETDTPPVFAALSSAVWTYLNQ